MSAQPHRAGFAATILIAAAHSTARIARMRWRVPILATLGVLGIAAWLVGAFAPDRFSGRTLYCLLSWWLVTSVVVPWVTLFLAVQLVHGALEDRTFQYLFLRPVGRVPMLLGNWLSLSVITAGLGSVFAWGLCGVLALHEQRWPDGVEWSLATNFTLANVLVAVAHAAVGVLFAVTFRRPLVWAAFFVVGLQMLTANLPVSAGLRRLTITDPVRRLVMDRIEPDAQLAQALWPAEAVVTEDRIGAPVWDLCCFLAVTMIVAAWIHARAEYDGRARD